MLGIQPVPRGRALKGLSPLGLDSVFRLFPDPRAVSWGRLGSRGGLEARDGRRGTIGPRRRRLVRGAGRARGGGGGGRGMVGTAPGPPWGRGGVRARRASPAGGGEAAAARREPGSLGVRGGEGTLAARPGFRGRGRGRRSWLKSGSAWVRGAVSRAVPLPPCQGHPGLRAPPREGGCLGPSFPRRSSGGLALSGPGCFTVVLASLSLPLLACGLVINPFPSKVGP